MTAPIGLYIALPVYLVVISLAAAWAHRYQAKLKRDDPDSVTRTLSTHFLAGRSFGPILTAGTVFATLFSGYTVVGLPNEAYYFGFISIRWIGGLTSSMLGFVGTGVRLRKVSVLRNHYSPVDFITDRYRSQILRYSIFALQIIPSIIYISAQVVAIKGTFNQLFEINDPDSPWAAVCIMSCILVFEWIGGLSSVALTDAIQGFIMIGSFAALPIVIKRKFGGWNDLDLSVYPRPDFYQTPDREDQWLYWSTFWVSLGFFTLPHFVQRTYAARDAPALKGGYFLLTFGVFLTTLSGLVIGTIGVQILAGLDPPPANPFAAVVQTLINMGGFAEVVAIIAYVSTFAAIMSTADSLLIAISHLVTCEVILPLKPDISARHITWIARLTSLVTVALALVFGLFWQRGISQLALVQFGISMQAAPAFFIGCFAFDRRFDVHPWIQAFSGLAGMVAIFAIYFGYVNKSSDPRQVNVGFTGICINFALLVILESGRRLFRTLPGRDVSRNTPEVSEAVDFEDRPAWDFPNTEKFGDGNLGSTFMWKMMTGIREPLINGWFLIGLVVSTTYAAPLVPALEPPIVDGAFVYAPAVVRGLPAWAFKSIVSCTVPAIMILLAIVRIPASGTDEVDMNKSGKGNTDGEAESEEVSDETAPFNDNGRPTSAQLTAKTLGSGVSDSDPEMVELSEESAV